MKLLGSRGLSGALQVGGPRSRQLPVVCTSAHEQALDWTAPPLSGRLSRLTGCGKGCRCEQRPQLARLARAVPELHLPRSPTWRCCCCALQRTHAAKQAPSPTPPAARVSCLTHTSRTCSRMTRHVQRSPTPAARTLPLTMSWRQASARLRKKRQAGTRWSRSWARKRQARRQSTVTQQTTKSTHCSETCVL